MGVPLSRASRRENVPQAGHVERRPLPDRNPSSPCGRTAAHSAKHGTSADSAARPSLWCANRPLHPTRTTTRDSGPRTGSNRNRRIAVLNRVLLSEHAGASYSCALGRRTHQSRAGWAGSGMADQAQHGAQVQGQGEGSDASPFRKGDALGTDPARTQSVWSRCEASASAEKSLTS